ncbi:hypothetical protein AKJ45_03590 [candidate division MSBL1 archaeon SCGC-AAA261F19]|uniref:Uncharacterized protein n=1 Tax=candidate division MSBL1 archaeon SCGC-AAA261F19 TaxID=1698275 RepID=A0A133V771_9EURY|nr:hypothetical protein AKJ45_03590 [candidate division MSBL1 archaeon SCGC-AAA261F19]
MFKPHFFLFRYPKKKSTIDNTRIQIIIGLSKQSRQGITSLKDSAFRIFSWFLHMCTITTYFKFLEKLRSTEESPSEEADL